jgi:3-hydroxyisobutyrate dehydrogenase-like beta-hydroxyacid dehydrogenase
MGLPMAKRLAAAGHKVFVHDKSSEAMEIAGKVEGFKLAPSPAEVAENVGVLFTTLPNNEIVRAVYLDEGGIVEGGKRGLVTCDCSTVSPEVSQALSVALAKKGIHHMDTTMLGSTPQAQEGQIFFIVAGDEKQVPKIKPYLEVMGKAHHYVGPSGSGNWIKLLHNILVAINAQAVSEVLGAALAAGVSLKDFYHVVVNGGGQGYSTYFNSRVMRMHSNTWDATFTLELMNKDVNLAVALAEKMGGPMGIMKATQAAFNEAVKHPDWARQDLSAVTHLMEEKIGKKVTEG